MRGDAVALESGPNARQRLEGGVERVHGTRPGQRDHLRPLGQHPLHAAGHGERLGPDEGRGEEARAEPLDLLAQRLLEARHGPLA